MNLLNTETLRILMLMKTSKIMLINTTIANLSKLNSLYLHFMQACKFILLCKL